MYKYLLSAFILIIPGYQLSQKDLSCCGKDKESISAIRAFTAFANEPAFVRAHPQPRPMSFHSVEGHDISYRTADLREAHGFLFSTATPSDKYLLVIHDYFGLGVYAKTESLKLFHDLKDVNVLDLDLYDRKVTTNRDTAALFMKAVKTERAIAIIKGAISYAGENAKIGTIGWCFGGGWSLQTALLAGKNTAACVVFYGMPETNVNKLKLLHSDVLGIFANKDKWITPAVVTTFEHNMALAGKGMEVKRYDADHGFGNPSSPQHDEAAALDAYNNALAYLQKRFK